MRWTSILLTLPLVACASVEDRTDANSGAGFSSTTIDGAQGPQATTVDATMRGFEPVPTVSASGGATTMADAAAVAIAAGGSESGAWTPVSVGGATFALRQVRADGFDFAVAEPQGRDAEMSPQLLQQTAIRTGCLTTDQTWQDDGRIAMALDCS